MNRRARPSPATGRPIARLFLLISTCLISPGSIAWALNIQEDLAVTQIVVDPSDSKTLYSLTTYAIGVMKSTDGGDTWAQINQGIRSYSLYQLAIHPKDPKVLYLGAGGAGLYKTTDGGATWNEMNDGLQNTDIGNLVLHPNDPEIVYVVTSTGLFKSPDGGKSWIALNQGDDFSSSQQFQSLVVLPTSPPTFFLASKKGLYTRKEGDGGWVLVRGILEGKQISALAYEPKTKKLYAAVFRRGRTMETLHEGGLFVSDDGGKRWSRLWKGLAQDWIRVILIDPVNPRILYLGLINRGVLKSTDGGKGWKEINVGLTDPDLAIRTLVMDPRDPKSMYAGSNGHWLFHSNDSGATWKPLPVGPHQTSHQILAAMIREDEEARKNSKISPPSVFEKCNKCHGWTDPLINRSRGAWRVSPNRRDWTMTVKRMSAGARLTSDQEVEIAGFLTAYTLGKQSAGK